MCNDKQIITNILDQQRKLNFLFLMKKKSNVQKIYVPKEV